MRDKLTAISKQMINSNFNELMSKFLFCQKY